MVILYTCFANDPRWGAPFVLGSKGQCQTLGLLPKWFLHDNSLHFDLKRWYFTYVFQWLEKDPFLLWDQKVKVQGQRFGLMTEWFPHDNLIRFWPSMMILHSWACMTPEERKAQGQTFGLLKKWFPHDNSFTFDLQYWYFAHVLPMTPEGPLLILGPKGQRSRSNIWSIEKGVLLGNSIIFWSTMLILYTCVSLTRRGPILILGSRGQKPRLNVSGFLQDSSHTCVVHEPKRSPIDIGIKRPMLNVGSIDKVVYGDSIIFWPTIMILNTCDVHYPWWTHICFWIKRTKVKVKLRIWSFSHFHRISPLSFYVFL